MNKKQFLNYEGRKLRKFKLLPNSYKTIGFGLMILSVISLIILSFLTGELEFMKSLAKNCFLISMLIISISKDKVEDEFTIQLRAKSYSLAFVIGVIYAIIQPYVNYFVSSVIKPEKVIFAEFDSFVILWFMLAIQLAFYYVLKITR